MKKITLSLVLFFTVSTVLGQSFMHGAGVTVLVADSKGSDVSVAEGFTYSPRFNFLETESLSISVSMPLSVAISASYNYYSSGGYYSESSSIGFVVNIPLIINLNMGRGSTKENRQKFGYFVGAGFGYHHGDFLIDDYYYGVISESSNSHGPATNAGMRFGVGRMHKNIEVRFSYMKGINDNKPSIFGAACAFNF
jgi:hypothetical protein